jgi:hypothetical protein
VTDFKFRIKEFDILKFRILNVVYIGDIGLYIYFKCMGSIQTLNCFVFQINTQSVVMATNA